MSVIPHITTMPSLKKFFFQIESGIGTDKQKISSDILGIPIQRNQVYQKYVKISFHEHQAEMHHCQITQPYKCRQAFF